jgi:phenylacetate-coenzyme A ligase PaaK-like adenylate-forming protein
VFRERGARRREPTGRAGITFATDCCIVELVDDDDRPVPPGATSSGILVTNLFNRGQPLIRYRIDDRVVQLAPASMARASPSKSSPT